MKTNRIKEKLREFGTWIRKHKEQTMLACIAAGVLAAAAGAAGISVRLVRTASFPEDWNTAARETVLTPEPTQDFTPELTLSPTPEPTPPPAPELTPEPTPPPEPTTTPEPAPERPHVHDWIPITATVHRDAVTHTVHHDPVTETVHHEAAVHEEPVYEYRAICDTCGADITGAVQDHIGPVCQGSYTMQKIQTGVNIITDLDPYDEEVVIRAAWDETVVDQEAHDEVITAGYRCSRCGAVKDP